MSMYGDVSVGLDTGPGMTKQAPADSCDINKIMARYQKTGLISHLAGKPGDYLDVSGLGDYREALEKVRKAESLFVEMPASVRSRVVDPAGLIEFLSDEKNVDEAVALGLAVKPVADEPVVVPPKPAAVGG